MDSIGKRVVEAIAAMDLSKLADCFTDDAAMSALIPGGLRERSGPTDSAALISSWFADSTELKLTLYVLEAELGHVSLGQSVSVRADSFPERVFNGQVRTIATRAEFTPRNVQTVADRIKQVFGVKIRLPSNDDRLRAGMSADVYFPNVK